MAMSLSFATYSVLLWFMGSVRISIFRSARRLMLFMVFASANIP